MARKRTPNYSIYINSASDYTINDNLGRTLTPDEARAAWEAGKVTDCNMAFQTFARLGFDVDALKAHYGDGGR